jgi:sigma-E factor negative regulatory protein RseC
MQRTEIEIGKVLEVGRGRAKVEVSPSGMCSHCELAGTCVPASGGTRIIEVADPLGVTVGRRVRIELGSGTFLLASFMAYILPLLVLFTGAAIGFYSAPEGSAELRGALGALLGLAAGLQLSRIMARRLSGGGKLTPAITGVLPDEDEEREEE